MLHYFDNSHRKRSWDLQQYQAKLEISTAKRLCYTYRWIQRGFCIMNCLNTEKQLNFKKNSYRSLIKQCKNREKILNTHTTRKVLLFHDNVRPHVALAIKDSILEYPSYSSDLVPSDYYLFRSL